MPRNDAEHRYKRGPRWPLVLSLPFFTGYATTMSFVALEAVRRELIGLLVIAVIFGVLAVLGIPVAIKLIVDPYYLPREDSV